MQAGTWAEVVLLLPEPVATAGMEICAVGACAGGAGGGAVLSWYPVAHRPRSHEHEFESVARQTLCKRPSSFLLTCLTPT